MQDFDLNAAAVTARFHLAEACAALSLRTAVVADPLMDLNADVPANTATARATIEAARDAYVADGPMADSVVDALIAAYAALGHLAIMVREPEGLIITVEADAGFAAAIAAVIPPEPVFAPLDGDA